MMIHWAWSIVAYLLGVASVFVFAICVTVRRRRRIENTKQAAADSVAKRYPEGIDQGD